MRFIQKKSCRELSTVHNSNGSYESLDKNTQSIVLKKLLEEQGYICGFCMRRISEENATIEHLIGQKFNISIKCDGKVKKYDYSKLIQKHQGVLEDIVGKIKKSNLECLGKIHDTNYANMIAVCKGDENKFCPNGITCDKKRAEYQSERPILFITPLNKMKMDKIKFSKNGTIYYNERLNEKEIKELKRNKKEDSFRLDENSNIEYDLNHVLNLNCDKLVEKRGKILERIRNTIFYKKNNKIPNEKVRKKRANDLLNKWKNRTDGKFDEFCEVAIFLLRKYI